MVHDRLRAKPPTTDADRWQSGTVRDVRETEGGTAVTVAADDGEVVVTVTDAVFELFASRVAATDPVGETVWFR